MSARRYPKNITIEFDGETVTLEKWTDRAKLKSGVTVYVQSYHSDGYRSCVIIPAELHDKYQDGRAAPRIVSADWSE